MCGLKSSKVKNQQESREHARILRAVRAFTNAYQMPTTDESIEYDSNARKWTVRVKPCCENELYRLELMVHNPDNCCRIRAKRLTGEHLMSYLAIKDKDKVICFLYNSLGCVRTFVDDRKLSSSKDKEMFLSHILADVVAGVVELDRAGRCHSQLTWENIEVIEDQNYPQVYHGKIGALEYVVHKSQMKPDKLASLPHLPPEVLKSGLFSHKVDLCKAQTYILGSLMLELLTEKHMSGVRFQQPTPDLTTSTAYDNIKENHRHLNTLIVSTRLSDNLQTVLQRMLEIKPDQRCSLNEALSYLTVSQPPTANSHRSSQPTVVTINERNVTVDDAEPSVSTTRLDNTSLITEDRSVEYFSDDKGVYVNGVRISDSTHQPVKLDETTSTKTIGNITVTRTTSKTRTKTTDLDGNQSSKPVDHKESGTTPTLKSVSDRPLSRWSSRPSRDGGRSTKTDYLSPANLPTPKPKGSTMGKSTSAKAPLMAKDSHSSWSASTQAADYADESDKQEWYYNLDISYSKIPPHTTSDVSTSNLF